MPAGTGTGGTIEERVIAAVVYLKLPAAESALTGGKAWTKIDLASLAASSSFGALGQDPTQLLSTLKSVSDSVTKVGTETIRGVQTTHYRAQIDLLKAAAASGSGAGALDQYRRELGSSILPEDVYLDGNGLARRFSVSITPTTAGPGTAASASIGSFSTTVELLHFGQADTRSIVAPPADEVANLPAALSSILG